MLYFSNNVVMIFKYIEIWFDIIVFDTNTVLFLIKI